ncbi:MAG: response regulator [Caulobacter sp.]|nr:response regulator [Caulobacter sp.]
MASIDRLIDRRAPVAADSPITALIDLFGCEPDAAFLAVVDADCRPVGLVRRDTVEALAGLPGGLDGAIAVRDVMAAPPLVVEAHVDTVHFRDDILATDPAALNRGFIVTQQGAYLGVGDALSLLVHRSRRAQVSREAGANLTQTLATEVVRQLDGAQTFVDGLLRQPLPADSRSCARALHDCFGDVQRLMRRAAGMHAAELGLGGLTPRPTVLRDIMDGVEARWATRAADAGVTLLTSYDGAPDLVAELDGKALAELFDGLVERALDATRRGAVEATLSARPALEGLALEGRVRDAGGPIEPARLAHIFDPLNSGAPLGVGLGMAHAASLATVMNGTIRAVANPGSGASVIFEMIAPEAVETSPAATAAAGAATAHILIVDDNATNRMVAEALCEMFDCTSEQVVDGVEAVEAASQRGFDLILMDIKMPRMDGVAATRAIRALPGAAGQVPIVALTANADPADVRGYLEAGMNDCVEKPIKAERLLTVLDQVLNGTGETGKSSAAA